jgi:protein translocase SecG subunit
MSTYLNISQIIVSVMLIAVILLQTRGEGSGLTGGGQNNFRVRTGVDLLLFRLTITLTIIFIVLSVVSVRFSGF